MRASHDFRAFQHSDTIDNIRTVLGTMLSGADATWGK